MVYTAVVGDRDPLRPPAFIADNVDYVCFTDDLERPAAGWALRAVEWVGRDPIRSARRCKLLSHRYFNEYDFSLWVDANIVPACDPWKLVELFGMDADLVLHQHPHRRCVYEEAAMCIAMYKERIGALEKQSERYEREGLPHHSGLFETGVLLRRRSDAVAAFNERWWEEIVRHSSRDQISLPYVLMKSPIVVATFPFALRDNSYLLYHHHEIRPHRRYRTYLAFRRNAGRLFRALCRSLKGLSGRA